MLIDHIHFYVKDARKTCRFLEQKMGFQSLSQKRNADTYSEVMTNHDYIFFVISSPLSSLSPVYRYLKDHASGVIDIAFQVNSIDKILQQSSREKLTILDAPKTYWLNAEKIKIAKVKGWHSLEHTLVENTTNLPSCLLFPHLEIVPYFPNIINPEKEETQSNIKPLWYNNLATIDHLVLNVAKGELTQAAQFYNTVFGFEYQENFKIKTPYSGLYSEVFRSPQNHFYFNINEPTSANSQIQQFIDYNGGSGLQHIALTSTNIINTVTQMRRRGLAFLPVSPHYYIHLKQGKRQGFIPHLSQQEWQAIEKQKILVDFDQQIPDSLLMQIFTQVMFNKPTFFFEFIERRKQAQGFGEGNFQTLFELIEKEQMESV